MHLLANPTQKQMHLGTVGMLTKCIFWLRQMHFGNNLNADEMHFLVFLMTI